MAKMTATLRDREKERLAKMNQRLDEQEAKAQKEKEAIDRKIERFRAKRTENEAWIKYLDEAPVASE